MIGKRTYVGAIFLSLLIVTSCKLAENDYYVSPTGDNHNPGNIEYPWKTISHGISHIKSGTLHITAGVYEEAISLTQSGTANNPITIVGEVGAIVDGSFGYNYPGKGLINIENASYINLEGITVRNAQTHGIMVQGICNNIQIRNCRTEHTRGSGIIVFGEWPFTGYHISNILIENNDIHWPQEGHWDLNNIWQEDITICGGIDNFTIHSNYINAYDSVSYEMGPSGICIKSGVKNGTISNNIIENIPGTGIQINAGKAEIKSINVYKNEIKHVTNFGILIGAIEGGPVDSLNLCFNTISHSSWAAIACDDFNKGTNSIQPKSNIDIFNNTIYRPGRKKGDGYGIITGNSYSGKIYNNIVVGCSDKGMQLGHADLEVTNNCLFNKDNGDTGANALLADPQFVAPFSFNFSLKSTSPCIDAGISYESKEFNAYAQEFSKWQARDLGAIEFISIPTTE